MKEFVDFLSDQSPYDALDTEDLERLARRVEVEFAVAKTWVVSPGSPPLGNLWVVRAGLVEVLDRGSVVDHLGPGDTFGHVSLLSGLSPAMSVRAVEDCVLYVLPDPRGVLEHPERLRFSHYGTLIARPRLTGPGLLEGAERPVSTHARPIVWCTAETSVREAARRMSEARTSCALVTTHAGVGIVTDSDFRLAAGGDHLDLDSPVAAMARVPVLCLPEDASVAAGFLRMIEHGVHHLVLTSRSGRPTGVVRVVDMTATEIRDPLLVRDAITAATDVDQLRAACRALRPTAVELAASGLPAAQVASLLAAVTEAALRRLTQVSGALTDDTEVPDTSLLVLGSLARREFLPLSDVDTGLVWSDAPRATGAGEPARHLHERAERFLGAMESCGLRRCPDGVNASNPLFSRSAAGWRRASTTWREHPGDQGALLLTSIVADSRPVTGAALGRDVLRSLAAAARGRDFLEAMTRFTLELRPPTGFVRDFVVEHSGEHRGRLDLKRGGLRPLTALGRWVAVLLGDTRGSTSERLRRGAAAGLLTHDEAESLVGAHTQIFSLLLSTEIASIVQGGQRTHHVDPRTLDSLTRRYLRESFRAISGVQNVLQSEWVSRLP